jgi:hypothetical protein
MGIYTDLLANAESWDAGGPDEISIGTDRIITMQIKRFLTKQGDTPYPSDYAEADEIQLIGVYAGSVTSGNFTLAFSLQDGTTFTTANIAYDASGATIESAIDTAASGTVAGWGSGDIGVTLTGDLTANPATLTYSGTSVDALNHDAVVITDIDLGGGGTVGTVSTTTNGQSDRTAMAVLNVMGVIDSPPPPQGTVSGIVATSTRESNPFMPGEKTLQALARQATIEDNTDALYGSLMTAMGLERLL